MLLTRLQREGISRFFLGEVTPTRDVIQFEGGRAACGGLALTQFPIQVGLVDIRVQDQQASNRVRDALDFGPADTQCANESRHIELASGLIQYVEQRQCLFGLGFGVRPEMGQQVGRHDGQPFAHRHLQVQQVEQELKP